MLRQIKIRPAIAADIGAITKLRRTTILGTPRGNSSRAALHQWAEKSPLKALNNQIADACLLVAVNTEELLGCAALRLASRELLGLLVSPAAQGQGLGQKMVARIEKLAVQYGLLQLKVCAAEGTINFYRACGYRAITGENLNEDPRSGVYSLLMQRRFPRRQTHFGRTLSELSGALEIPADYGIDHKLRFQKECSQTTSIGTDMAGREALMETRAACAWLAAQTAARQDGIELQAASAFRTVAYQAGIIKRKIEAGQPISEILKVSAAPGYSEHHSGRALDITTPGCKPLEEEFDNSPAYRWLKEKAGDFGFSLSYPHNNRHKLAYEPWHWCWKP